MIRQVAYDFGLHDGSEGGANRVQIASNDLPRPIGSPAEELTARIRPLMPAVPGAGVGGGGALPESPTPQLDTGHFFSDLAKVPGASAR